MGILGVIVVLPIQKFIQANVDSATGQLMGWATAEEVVALIQKQTAKAQPAKNC